MLRKIIVSALALALVGAANLRVVYRVSAGGEEVGVYGRAELRECVAFARDAAKELGGGEPEYSARARVTLAPECGDADALREALLENTPGVEEVYAVSVGGSRLGLCSEPSALGEVLEARLASGACTEATAVWFENEPTLRRIFAPEGLECDLMELFRALRENTRVVSSTSGGAVRYG